VVFASIEDLRKYYIKSTKKINGKRKPEEVNCGDLKSFDSDNELNKYLSTLKPLCRWRLFTN
jgi:hypothetical protein